MQSARSTPRQLLIVLPSWVGDAAMATPTLRALRELYRDARITYLLKDYVRPVIDASPWHDRLIVVRRRKTVPGAAEGHAIKRRPHRLLRRLRRRKFDTAILLPNSFRSALLVSTAGIPRRIGYDRDGRGLLLTDRLLPMKRKGRYVPIPAVDYYLGLARYLGSASLDRRLKLFTRPDDDARAEQILGGASGGDERPLVLLNPGAATKGAAKLWPAQQFAALADELTSRCGVTVLLSGAPGEREILDAIHAAARASIIDLPGLGCDLTLLKSILLRCSLVVTNDTGTRHLAAGLGAPVLSLFGPTDPRWTALDYDREQTIQSPDGSMDSLTVPQVLLAAQQMLQSYSPTPHPPAAV